MRLTMLGLAVGLALLSLVAGSECPNKQVCGDQQTCCLVQSSGEYNCCPFHQGECCADHLHCCPEGMLCQAAESKCSNSTHSLPWTERISAKQTGLPKSFRMISSTVASKDDIICPDNTSCPAEFSCLKLSDKYECCPVTQGIVCADGKHCCPVDHKCSVDSTSCVKKQEPVRSVMCADGVSECPVQSLCCENADGGWGCCPMLRAVCCEDKVHCCPEDSVCHVNTSRCVTSTKQELPMWGKFAARLRADWEDHKLVTPKMTTKHPETTTVLTTTAGTTTTVTTTLSTAVSNGSDIPCDDTVACPDGTTCCDDGQGGWACCPLPQAVCCDDHEHCCPHGKKCNLAAQKCDDASGSVPWLKKTPSRPIRGKKLPETKGSDIPCDDTVACPDETTCCDDGQGGWACCPLPQAVCCDDHEHCCPHGKKCNLTALTCDDSSGSMPWLKKTPSRPIRGKKLPKTKGSDIPCDDTVACPDETTCCDDGQGGWACCPLPQAVCCDDHEHCCPHGKKCNLAAQKCDDASGSVPWLKKTPSRPIRGKKLPETKGSDIPCDDTVACPDETTCCDDGQGGWACCPLPQAVCCDDHEHCCPHGKKCNLAAQKCDDASGSVPWLKKTPSRPIKGKKLPETKGSDIPCDDTVACPDETTCCDDGQGGWACCPLPQAVCCDDHEHCCPHGKKCNLTALTCDDASGSVPWLKKTPSRPIRGKKLPKTKGSDIPCDDTVACPDETTCCDDGQGGWACCPLPQAVCCDDHEHCCPHGKKCNLAAQTCDDNLGSMPWLKKMPSRPIRGKKLPETKGSDIPCDDTKACPDETTCCKNGQGGWGCCPLPQAVCCDDHEHCCPHGKKCNLAAQTCDDNLGSIPWLKKMPSRPITGKKPLDKVKGQKTAANVSCDSSHSCPPNGTCCKDVDGHWSCCPYAQGMCCKDRFHCCPNDTTCNFRTLTCDKGGSSVPMALIVKSSGQPAQKKKVEEKPKEDQGHGDVRCDDKTSCPDGTTCCFIPHVRKWGCCPLPNAVCCQDGAHCCPAQYKCDPTQTSCIKDDVVIPWYTKVPAESSLDKSPEQQILFYTSASCCSDREHCCPKGYSCDEDSGSCVKTIILQLETVPLTPIKQLHNDIQCGGGFTCKDTETCCKTSETSWGCCPIAQAVCCSDMQHCCAPGYTCLEGGVCTQTTGFNWDHWQVFFSRKKRAQLV
ncbi:hypothetical protein NFI96_012370 [Prochilodus magdalenae]|nr:hypothetical protein NFI96_012370 [Prochilodus magdalenae]